MSKLVLVRHAQAATFENNSDRLTSTGEQQAIALGEFFRSRNISFDEIYSGIFERHTRTAQLAGFDQFAPMPEFNEYDAAGILRSAGHTEPARDNRELQARFDALMPQWIAGTLDASGVESFAEFRARVQRGIRKIIEADRGSRRVIVFTSGGPIGVSVQTVVGAKEPMAVELNWRIRNCSLTEFLFTRKRISLDSFNATPHLTEVTFR